MGSKIVLRGDGRHAWAFGLIFAIVVLGISAISFPLLLDRDVGAITAMLTSVRAVWTNQLPMEVWGMIVAV